MNTIKDGGPAFPVTGMTQRGDQAFMGVFDHGMTLRDYFATHATDADIEEYQLEYPLAPGQKPYQKYTRTVARWRFADAMLAAREAQP